jgi:hypothetical protein
MWNLSLNDILSAKEELNGRRAAVKARYEKDLQAIEDDLRNIMTLETAASAFLQAHRQERASEEAPESVASVEEADSVGPAPAVETVAELSQQAYLSERDEPEPALSFDANSDRKVSRWRIR